MKKMVRFESYNAGEFYGHEMVICDSRKEAEYEIILRNSDEIYNTENVVELVRDGVCYAPTPKMNKFKGVNFRSLDPFYNDIQFKLIEI